ncbi:unnamed protein product [Ectocarpus sp. 12 AP-2014]
MFIYGTGVVDCVNVEYERKEADVRCRCIHRWDWVIIRSEACRRCLWNEVALSPLLQAAAKAATPSAARWRPRGEDACVVAGVLLVVLLLSALPSRASSVMFWFSDVHTRCMRMCC